MTATAILKELQSLGSESIKKVMRNHGVKEPFFGVKIGDMKPIVKRIRKDYQLALDLYDTGNYDAMYLAGLIADDARMTKKDLQRWVAAAQGGSLAGCTVPWVAAGSAHGWELATEWIDSKKDHIAAAGWATLGSIISIKPDTELDLAALKKLLQRVETTIHQQPDRVRYQMNGFVIALGGYVASMTEAAIKAGERIGKLSVDLGNNSCEAFFAPDYIRKMQARGNIGKKRKSAKC